MKILIAPSGFKESLDSVQAADCIERGILRAHPTATVHKMPLVDGGEGFVRGLVEATNGRIIDLTVTGPIGVPVRSHFGFLGDREKTAVIEMAAAAGLRLIPCGLRDPTKTTTFGVGETILAALDAGAERILFGCGDSGTCDAGAGMIQALGGRLIDCEGQTIPLASGITRLDQLSTIDLSRLDDRLKTVKVDVACNWHNVLCGPRGVARFFGPQKGASSEQVELMSAAMDRCAEVMGEILGRDISRAPGSGASGGLGAGLSLIGAELHPRCDIVMEFFRVDELMADTELVITAEGGIDYQTPRGKMPAEVAARAKRRGLPVIALAGTIGEGAKVNYAAGIDAYTSIMQRPMSLDVAIAQAERLLSDGAEGAMRMILVGQVLGRTPVAEPTASLPFRRSKPTKLAKQRASTFSMCCV